MVHRGRLRLALFLLLGAIATLAISIVSTMYWRSQVIRSREKWYEVSGGLPHSGTSFSGLGWSQFSWRVASASDSPSDGVAALPAWGRRLFARVPSESETQTIIAIASGWPMRSFVARFDVTIEQIDFNRPPVYLVGQVHGGMVLHNGKAPSSGTKRLWDSMTVLPLYPVWSGLVINTLCLASVLWLLFGAPFALRRALRMKNGQCPRCAYPVAESEVCTECGCPIDRATGIHR
jgi:hypothetical protein